MRNEPWGGRAMYDRFQVKKGSTSFDLALTTTATFVVAFAVSASNVISGYIGRGISSGTGH
jgi:hypothetical protein